MAAVWSGITLMNLENILGTSRLLLLGLMPFISGLLINEVRDREKGTRYLKTTKTL